MLQSLLTVRVWQLPLTDLKRTGLTFSEHQHLAMALVF
jgi:hypothetical protein